MKKIVAVVADNTGNTRVARQKLVADAKHVLNLQDVCDLLHNTVQDIGMLPEYQEVRTSTFFEYLVIYSNF